MVTGDRDKISRLVGVIVGYLLISLTGCATSPEPEQPARPDRQVPPEITDRTTQRYLDDGPAARPYVDVMIEWVSGAVFPTDGAAALIEREGLRCYRLGRKQQQDLEGTIVYELMITTNGRVAGVDIMSSSFQQEQVESCMERILLRLRFDVEGRNAPLFSRLYARVSFAREIYEEPEIPEVDAE